MAKLLLQDDRKAPVKRHRETVFCPVAMTDGGLAAAGPFKLILVNQSCWGVAQRVIGGALNLVAGLRDQGVESGLWERVMRKAIRISTAMFAALGVSASLALADDARRVSFEARPAADGAGIVIEVAGREGHYRTARLGSAALPVSVMATVSDADGDFKIIASDVALKGEGVNPLAAGDGPFAVVPGRSVTFDRRGLDIRMDGLLMRDAIAACNRLPASERVIDGREVSLNAGVVWRVATARFQFNWRNYDRVGPADAFLKNPDFYSDRDVATHDATIDVKVVCKGIGAGAAVAASDVMDKPSTTRRVTLEPRATDAADVSTGSVKTAAATAAGGAPGCDGGMVRELSDGSESYLCLCPGNTRRIAKGDNAFACVRPRR